MKTNQIIRFGNSQILMWVILLFVSFFFFKKLDKKIYFINTFREKYGQKAVQCFAILKY